MTRSEIDQILLVRVAIHGAPAVNYHVEVPVVAFARRPTEKGTSGGAGESELSRLPHDEGPTSDSRGEGIRQGRRRVELARRTVGEVLQADERRRRFRRWSGRDIAAVRCHQVQDSREH